jgi:hypothetical protein
MAAGALVRPPARARLDLEGAEHAHAKVAAAHRRQAAGLVQAAAAGQQRLPASLDWLVVDRPAGRCRAHADDAPLPVPQQLAFGLQATGNGRPMQDRCESGPIIAARR